MTKVVVRRGPFGSVWVLVVVVVGYFVVVVTRVERDSSADAPLSNPIRVSNSNTLSTAARRVLLARPRVASRPRPTRSEAKKKHQFAETTAVVSSPRRHYHCCCCVVAVVLVSIVVSIVVS
jgi:hypothetical protein